MAWINKHISTFFFLVYFGYYSILGETLSAPLHYQVVNVSSLQPKPYCQSSSSGSTIGSQKLEIVSRYGPCFPNAKTPTSDQLLNLDQVRVRSINKRHKSKHVAGNLDHGYYVVKIGLGTPRQNYTLMVDTGSKSTWVRCNSCTKGCKSDDDSLYDPSKSSTYTNNTSCSGSFNVSYRDKSSVNGIWGCDTLTVDDLGAITNFKFGCGQENVDPENFGGLVGILGLGKGETSLLSQSVTAMQMFSYYIPLTSSLVGNLHFGNEAKTKSHTCATQFTPLVKGDNPVYYYLDLVGISVAGKKLNVSSTTFTSRGTIIDSGTVITRFPDVVYSALRAEFRQSMLSYTLLEGKVVDGLMDTCYSLEGYNQVALPKITFHFGKGTPTNDVTLSNQATVWIPHDKKEVMCLAFAAKSDVSIIGNVQQRGLNVIYDLEGERIGFGSNCAS
ncbi:hypothetical protein RND71_042534 [Anisodus tanguticus]|uniref:Peptidase A1 domain-containing protein n=1 Tax=Anisodus tanguticus TaxID=243964 RepID=A0AAE1UP81_9SOLA|nr:hypothetical protein RND71_042534 [Anisodus tanguticus]